MMRTYNTAEEIKQGYEIAKAYNTGQVKGWDAEIAKQAFQLFGKNIPNFKLTGQTLPTDGKKRMLYDVTRKVLGKDTPNYSQLRGDCVSFSGKNTTEYTSCCQILTGKREKFRLLYPPYFYGTSRVLVGGQKGSYEDGSTGTWLAEAVKKYGALFADQEGVPKYNKDIAGQWGADGPPDNFIKLGSEHLIQSVASINSFDDLATAIVNGYCVSTCSNVGYSMEPGSDGFHIQNTEWGHAMTIIGIGYTPEPYGIILNSWADCHGHLKDFDDGTDLPIGVIRSRKKDVEKHIRAQETFAFSQYQGFPEQDLDKLLFKVVGN